MVKAITSSYKLNVAWKNKTVQQYYSPRQKLTTDPFGKPGITYKFKCHCETEYIREPKRISRINTTWNIIDQVVEPRSQTTSTFPIQKISNPREKLNFIKNCFKVTQSSLTNFNFRKDLEAIQIIY